MTITICVCGAGTMGSGIAQVCAQGGFDTMLFDIDESVLEKAKQGIQKNLQNLVNKEKMSSTQQQKKIINTTC